MILCAHSGLSLRQPGYRARRYTMKRLTAVLSVAVFLSVLGFSASAPWGQARAGDVGFVEDFSLAKDRTVPLKTLIPGTEDYYYYHCLNFQATGQLDEVDKMLTLWIARYNRTPRV